MAGQFLPIGGRLTYIPPFVNERFDGPPYWSCTFTALLNGANVAWLGQKPATHAEVAALAGASGDADTRHGSRARHMIRAIHVRYRQTVGLDNVTSAEAQRRLANGWALVAGVTYGELPPKFRHWSPHFKMGHRVTVLGFAQGRTRLIDPLATRDATYGGAWIAWSDFEQAWWSDEQLWFKEGAFVGASGSIARAAIVRPAAIGTPGAPPPTMVAKATTKAPAGVRILRRFEPARHFRVAADTTVVAFAAGKPPVVSRRLRFPHASGAMFDALVTFDRAVVAPEDPGRKFLRITKGAFAGRYIEIGARGITANIQLDGGAVPAAIPATSPAAIPAPSPAASPVAPAAAAATVEAAVLEARRAEWDRIAQATDGRLVLPPRP